MISDNLGGMGLFGSLVVTVMAFRMKKCFLLKSTMLAYVFSNTMNLAYMVYEINYGANAYIVYQYAWLTFLPAVFIILYTGKIWITKKLGWSLLGLR